MNNRTSRKFILMLADMFIIAVSAIITNFILSLSGIGGVNNSTLVIIAGVNMLFCMVFLYLFKAYAIMWRYFDIKDYRSCLIGTSIGLALSTVATFYYFNNIATMQFAVTNFFMCNVGIILFRLVFRKTFLVLTDAGRADNSTRVMIVGAGSAGRMIVNEMIGARKDPNNPSNMYNPICIVDDDTNIKGTAVSGIKIMGTTEDIPLLCRQQRIETIIFAIPSCSETERKRILDLCNRTGLRIKIIPYISQIFQDDTLLKQVKDIKIEDLLGRNPVTFDKESVKNLIKGKICLVTGGGGSIGSELIRQIIRYSPKQIIIVDIYENNAYAIQQELLMEYGYNINLVTLIASVRDYKKMSGIFEKYRPDIVFHAAAHKHVSLMEDSPEEAVKNNVVGTFNTAMIADFYKVKKFVMISTDKAVNPTNVMGATKRCCEMIAQYMAQYSTNTEFITTRFGNVLGSNGSVIPLFKQQIESGKPVTVTHPEIVRYFMTIPEAVSLVLQAGAMAHGGEIFVLDMGAPVKILTLAENMIRAYGKVPYKDVPIKFIGLRPGEKLYEELLMKEEGLKSTANTKIFIGNQIHISPSDFIQKLNTLKAFAEANDSEGTVKALAEIVPTFHHLTNDKNEVNLCTQNT